MQEISMKENEEKICAAPSIIRKMKEDQYGKEMKYRNNIFMKITHK